MSVHSGFTQLTFSPYDPSSILRTFPFNSFLDDEFCMLKEVSFQSLGATSENELLLKGLDLRDSLRLSGCSEVDLRLYVIASTLRFSLRPSMSLQCPFVISKTKLRHWR